MQILEIAAAATSLMNQSMQLARGQTQGRTLAVCFIKGHRKHASRREACTTVCASVAVLNSIKDVRAASFRIRQFAESSLCGS
jgi:hypothetical protein